MMRFLNGYARLLDGLIALLLAAMVVLIFSNVVLRYVFNSGITVSEEMSRWMFVWLTFIGAVIAIHRHAHLGTDFLVGRLPPGGKRICLVIGHLLMLWVCWLLLKGSWQQVQINAGVTAPASGLSMGIVYAAGVFFALSSAPLLAIDLVRALRGELADDELVMIKESEDMARFEDSPQAPQHPIGPRAG
jgi:TRAP-type C4-dicarboxylate transport system permease small subunit